MKRTRHTPEQVIRKLRDADTEEVDLAQAALDGLLLGRGQLLRCQPGAALLAEQVRGGRAPQQTAPASSRARIAASKRSDLTRACAIARTSAALASTTRATCGRSSRAIAIAPLVVSSTMIGGAQALGEQPERLWRGRDPARAADLAVLNDRDLTEVAVNIQPYRAHLKCSLR